MKRESDSRRKGKVYYCVKFTGYLLPFEGEDHRDVNAAAENHIVELVQKVPEEIVLKMGTL